MDPETETITIMTMNLRFGLAKDGENRWENRAPLVGELLSRYPADFIGFQEVNHFQARFLERHLPSHRHIGWHNRSTSWWQSNPVFFHRRWTCMGSRHHFLSETPDLPSKLKGSKWPRQCVAGWFTHRGREILVANTHFDFDPGVQARSAELVAGFIDKFPSGLPALITGDFNANPGSPAYQCFLSHGFREVFGRETATTYHEFKGRDTGKHIDWLLFRGDFRVAARQVVADGFNGRFPSDHYPVRAVLGGADAGPRNGGPLP